MKILRSPSRCSQNDQLIPTREIFSWIGTIFTWKSSKFLITREAKIHDKHLQIFLQIKIFHNNWQMSHQHLLKNFSIFAMITKYFSFFFYKRILLKLFFRFSEMFFHLRKIQYGGESQTSPTQKEKISRRSDWPKSKAYTSKKHSLWEISANIFTTTLVTLAIKFMNERKVKLVKSRQHFSLNSNIKWDIFSWKPHRTDKEFNFANENSGISDT